MLRVCQRNSVFAELDERKFEKKAYLLMIIGGAAFSQCLEPKKVSYKKYRASTRTNMDYVLPPKAR